MDIEDSHDIPENRGEDGMNVTERRLYDALLRLDLEPKPQYEVGRCTLDFAFPDESLAIEVNGPYHYTPEGKEQDRKRRLFLRHTNPPWTVRSFSSKRVFNSPDSVAREIKQILDKLPRTHYEGAQSNYSNSYDTDEVLGYIGQTKKGGGTMQETIEFLPKEKPLADWIDWLLWMACAALALMQRTEIAAGILIGWFFGRRK